MSDKGDKVRSINFAGKKGFEFKLAEVPETFEEFREFFMEFVRAFDISFTLNEAKFAKFPSKYVEANSVKEVNNVF